MLKYNLTRMLEEIRRDERGERRDEATAKKVLSQEEIKAMAQRRRKGRARKNQTT